MRGRPTNGRVIEEAEFPKPWHVEVRHNGMAKIHDVNEDPLGIIVDRHADEMVLAVNHHDALVAALELATQELNAIRARSGAPIAIQWTEDGRPLVSRLCTEEWWNELTVKCYAALAGVRGEG